MEMASSSAARTLLMSSNGKVAVKAQISPPAKVATAAPPTSNHSTASHPAVSTSSIGNGIVSSNGTRSAGIAHNMNGASATPNACAAAPAPSTNTAEISAASKLHQQRENLLRTFASHLGSQTLGAHNSGSPLSASPAPAYTKGTAAEAAAKRLGIGQHANTGVAGGGGHLGGGQTGGIGGFGVGEARAASSIMRYLHRDDSDPTGGATCSLPGLDLHQEGDPSTADPLPGVGQSFSALPDKGGDGESSSSSNGSAMADPSSSSPSSNMMPPPAPKGEKGSEKGPDVKIPAMAASVISSANASGSTNSASDIATSSERAASANEKATKLEQAAARNLGLRTVWTRSSAPQAPPAMLRSFSSSFSSLVDSRVRAWTLLLLRHSLTSGDDQSRSRLLGLLATSSSIVLTAAVTTFQPLSLPPEVKAKVEAEKSKEEKKDENDVVLPVIFEALTDVTIQGQPFTVPLRAPGTIAAKFSRTSELITYAEVKLDTNALVSSMVEQARLVVFKAVSKATAVSPSSLGLGSQFESSSALSTAQMGAASGGASAATLTQFNSALSLSKAAAINHTLGSSNDPGAKRTPSALRLSSYMRGKNGEGSQSCSGLSHTRKQRSVTWNNALDEPKSDSTNYPMAKRRKLEAPQPTLKTTRSFGKPDASLFESQKNATFAEFGRSHQHDQVPTFVNGKLHVPDGFQQNGVGGGLGGAGRSMHNLRNATFVGLGVSPRNGRMPQGMSTGGGLAGAANASFNLARNPNLRKMLTSTSRSANTSNPFSLVRRNNSGLVGSNNSGGNGRSPMPRTATALESLLLSATKGSRSGLNKR